MKNNKLDVRNVTGDMGNGNGSIADNRTQDGALQIQEDDGSFSYYGWGYRNMLLCASSEVFPSGNFAGALRAAVPQHWNIPGSAVAQCATAEPGIFQCTCDRGAIAALKPMYWHRG